ncbi:GMC family oxidoreductase [Paraburkholderia solisilvae]|uniref:GMC family oxidoreductase n=1 Tax=Paraburkholderia solisilvae TaxID=624376 RepID=UPI001C2E9B89|nr:GMC family oxidoreductase N-terminal domain-containing protein [Paraburkholderia solisilvae]
MSSEVFDYIVVGGGAAGSVLAARLSERADVSVLLIEAGSSDYAPEINVPLASMQLFKTKFDWDYCSEPEPALDRRSIYVPRGKTLGGSTSINSMLYLRGNPADYDEWARAGAFGWSYEELLPYFIKSERNNRWDDRWHGRGGPLAVQDGRSGLSEFDWFIDAAIEAGHPRNDDFNGQSQMGVGYYQLMQHRGVRCSAAHAYLHPAHERKNLTVKANALVTKVVLDGMRAVGVAVDRDGAEEIYRADREVILSAGSYNSPQLLMLSGIGPAAHLSGMGLNVVADLPVGEGLQDHPMLGLIYLTDERTLSFAGTAEDFRQFQTEGRGPLTSNAVEAGGFLSTQGHASIPDIQLYFCLALYGNAGLMKPHDEGLGIAVNLMKPLSRGRVSLRSSRPDAKPRILFNYFQEIEDRKVALEGVRTALEVCQQPSLRGRLRAPYLIPKSPDSTDIWKFVQENIETGHHPVGTCAIGTVVDPQLRVLGMDGLRVVDASVMPSIIRGNTTAPVIAIAERAADILNQ